MDVDADMVHRALPQPTVPGVIDENAATARRRGERASSPDAKLYRKGDDQESRLCYMGHVLMENRNGLAVTGDVTQATGNDL